MLGLRAGHTLRNVPAHHGVDLKTIANPARAARAAAAEAHPERWTPPVLRMVGTKGEGVEELLSALDRHHEYLERSGELRERRRKRLRERIVEVVERKVRQRLWLHPDTGPWIEERIPDLERGATTPFAVADELLAQSAGIISGASGGGGLAATGIPADAVLPGDRSKR
jgi:LAO/AO transport system kinase